MSDLEQILNGEQPEPVAEVEDTPTPEPEVNAAEEESAQPAPEPEAQPEEPAMVPLPALQEVRGENKELKQRLAELESRIPAPQPMPAPDYNTDPVGAVQHHVSSVEGAIIQQKLDTSRFLAEQQYGKEAVDAAYEYFNQHPEQSQALLNHPSPFHAAMEVFNQQKVASEIGSDPEGWMEKEREKIRAEIKAEIVAEQARAKAGTPAPSMADVNGTGGGPKPAVWNGPAKLENLF